MLDRELIEKSRHLLSLAIDDADAEVIDAIRRNDGRDGSRESLLAELDVLEKVRERLNVRYERATSSISAASRG